ncbi:MAG: hypothetical protein KME07_02860 [Pegethrix bostrychoides GSE-TBD4-15B]|uniref:Uncharacterized protein n=1 Tax=Pegethrix bostrychoides GSE-TBD4-15B TaxID=2839662 RepID=A0A951P840_9CYAN|nr:hypothetical protein [Pegethrix bostrychoides GSE-TBD4-15B]
MNLRQPVLAAVQLFNPLSWSLWVPLALLGLIVLAAVYFVRVRASR